MNVCECVCICMSVCVNVCMCVNVSVCERVCVWVCVHLCEGQKPTSDVFSNCSLPYFWDGICHWVKSSLIRLEYLASETLQFSHFIFPVPVKERHEKWEGQEEEKPWFSHLSAGGIASHWAGPPGSRTHWTSTAPSLPSVLLVPVGRYCFLPDSTSSQKWLPVGLLHSTHVTKSLSYIPSALSNWQGPCFPGQLNCTDGWSPGMEDPWDLMKVCCNYFPLVQSPL